MINLVSIDTKRFKTFGVLIRFHRIKNGLSQNELAKMLDVSRTTVAMWETGKRLPTRNNLNEIVNLFGIDLSEYYHLWLRG